MRKLKDRLTKARSSISMQTFKHPKLFVILFMILLNIVILLMAAWIAVLIDNQFDGYIDALFNGALKWLLTPNAILEIEHPPTLALSVAVLVVGLILFTGTIIGLATNMLKDYFASKDSNSGILRVEGHIVILNWNNKVPELIADLVYVKNRHMNIVMMGDVDKAYAERQIQQALKHTRRASKIDRLNVFIKNGDPLLKRDLESISIHKADAVLIMSKDVADADARLLSQSDLNIIRTLLSLGGVAFNTAPTLVAEVKDIGTKQKLIDLSKHVQSLRDYGIIPVCFDRRLGQIIAQSIIHPSIEDVYLSLFSFDGSEVYRVHDTTFEEVLDHHSHAIPLAEYGSDVFVLSLNDETKTRTSPHTYDAPPMSVDTFDAKALHDVTIIGSNNKLSFIEEAFESYGRLYQSPINVSVIPMDEVGTLIGTVNDKKGPLTLILLSDETAAKEVYDANVFNALLHIQTHLKKEDVHVIVELLDPRNAPLIKDFNIENTIISNKIVSLLLSKLALFPRTAVFYENLLTIEPSEEGRDDYAITIEKADTTFKETLPISFQTIKGFIISAYHATHKKAIPFGYVKNGELTVFEGDLHAKRPFTLSPKDEIVWMKV
ncbi:MAG: TrkA-related ion transporter [Candidatus Izemoplasmataceae bacterium]